MNMHEVLLPKTVTINEELFSQVKERRRGVGIYANASRTRYVRMGATQDVRRELAFQKELLQGGFPVAAVLQQGTYGLLAYWIEESLGAAHFGDLFAVDMEHDGVISDLRFDQFLEIVVRFQQAQQKTMRTISLDGENLMQTVYFEELVKELPDAQAKMWDAWHKMTRVLKTLPLCLTHGDFLPNNIMERGVIDLADHFEGPIGFDMVNAITTSYWFPGTMGFEYRRRSSFSESQIDTYLEAVRSYTADQRSWDILDYFDSLFLLRACWWTVRNQDMPLLQEWRYERFLELVDLFLEGTSLYIHWRESKDL